MLFVRQAVAAAIVVLSSTPLASAIVYPRLASEDPLYELQHAPRIRRCDSPCGFYGQLCCTAGQHCYTDSNNQAQCGDGAAAAQATVYSVAKPAPAAPSVVTVTVAVPVAGSGGSAPAIACNFNLGQTECGNVCCAQGQFCNGAGVCVNNGATTAQGVGGGGGAATITAPIRPTSISTYTVVTTGGVTTTVPFLMPASATAGVTATSTGSGLSGGAIAGIVIGVLAGIIILIIIIICCCARGLLDLFRPKRKTEVTEIYSSHHHAGGAPPPKRRFPFFGGGGNNTKRKEEGKGFLGVAGILAALALILGLKRRHDRREEEKEGSSAYTYSDYTYSYDGTSASSESSGRRSRGTRMTRSDIRGSRR